MNNRVTKDSSSFNFVPFAINIYDYTGRGVGDIFFVDGVSPEIGDTLIPEVYEIIKGEDGVGVSYHCRWKVIKKNQTSV